MVIIIGCLLISMIPSLLIYYWFAHMYRGDTEHTKTCRKLFWKGVLCVFGVLALDLAFTILWDLGGLKGRYVVVDNIFRCFVINAFVEELVKLTNAKKVIKERDMDISWLSFMMYTTIVAIGFGLFEDIVYAFSSNPGQILLRGINGHAVYGMITGYLLGKGYKYGEKKYRILGTVIPWLMHGFYNFGLSTNTGMNDDLSTVFMILTVLIAAGGLIYMIVMLLKIRKYREDPVYTEPFQLPENLKKS